MSTNASISTSLSRFLVETHVLGPAESHSVDSVDLLQAEGEESLAGLALRSRLDLVEGGGGSGVELLLLMVVLMIVLMLRVVGVDLFDLGRHLERNASSVYTLSERRFAHPSQFRALAA